MFKKDVLIYCTLFCFSIPLSFLFSFSSALLVSVGLLFWAWVVSSSPLPSLTPSAFPLPLGSFFVLKGDLIMQTKIYNECKNSFELPGRVTRARSEMRFEVTKYVRCSVCHQRYAYKTTPWDDSFRAVNYCSDACKKRPKKFA
jgi:hypothetical protein